MNYKYKAIHIPSQSVFIREVKLGYVYASGTKVVTSEVSFQELLSYWNYQSSLQNPVVWMYAKVLNKSQHPSMILQSDQIGEDPSELEISYPID